MKQIPKFDEFGVKPLGVSWSRLYTWEKCEQHSVFQMSGQGDTIKDGRRFIHGTLADRAMRKWLEQSEPQLPGQMDTYVDELWDELVTHSDEYKIVWKGDPVADKARVREIAKTVVNNVEPFLIKNVLPLEYQPEFRFKVPLQIPDGKGFGRTIVLNGGMDIACKDPDTGKVFLYDLKATTNEYYIQSGIMPQLIFYGIAWTYMFGTPLEDISAAFLTPYCKQQYHPLTVSRQDRQHLMTRIVRFANFVWNEETPSFAKDKSECFWCSAKSICPLFSSQLAPLRNDGKNRISLTATAQSRAKAKAENE